MIPNYSLKQVKQKIREHDDPEEISQLDISGIDIESCSHKIKIVLSKCKNIDILISRECGLTNLKFMPQWSLISLDLSQNELTQCCLEDIIEHSNLVQLNLSGNRFSQIEPIASLFKLVKLRQFDLFDNPVSNNTNLSDFIFQGMPYLKYFDGKDRTGEELKEDSDIQQDEVWDSNEDSECEEGDSYEQQQNKDVSL